MFFARLLTLKCQVFRIDLARLGSKIFTFRTYVCVSYERHIQIAELLARSQYEPERSRDREKRAASCVVFPFPKVKAELLSRMPFKVHDFHPAFPKINLHSFRQKQPTKRGHKFGITLASKVKTSQMLNLSPLLHSTNFQLNDLPLFTFHSFINTCFTGEITLRVAQIVNSEQL